MKENAIAQLLLSSVGSHDEYTPTNAFRLRPDIVAPTYLQSMNLVALSLEEGLPEAVYEGGHASRSAVEAYNALDLEDRARTIGDIVSVGEIRVGSLLAGMLEDYNRRQNLMVLADAVVKYRIRH